MRNQSIDVILSDRPMKAVLGEGGILIGWRGHGYDSFKRTFTCTPAQAEVVAPLIAAGGGQTVTIRYDASSTLAKLTSSPDADLAARIEGRSASSSTQHESVVRPSAAYALRTNLADMESILEAVRSFPEDTTLSLIEPIDHSSLSDAPEDDPDMPEHPWRIDWPGLRIEVHGSAIVLPVVGEWPLGPGRPPNLVDRDPATIRRIARILENTRLRTMDPSRIDDRFVELEDSLQRMLDRLIAEAQTRSCETLANCMDADGDILCEMRISEHGLPILLTEDGIDQYEVPTDRAFLAEVARNEPLCMEITRMDSGDVLLTPCLVDGDARSMNARLHDPMTLMRIMRNVPCDGVADTDEEGKRR